MRRLARESLPMRWTRPPRYPCRENSTIAARRMRSRVGTAALFSPFFATAMPPLDQALQRDTGAAHGGIEHFAIHVALRIGGLRVARRELERLARDGDVRPGKRSGEHLDLARALQQRHPVESRRNILLGDEEPVVAQDETGLVPEAPDEARLLVCVDRHALEVVIGEASVEQRGIEIVVREAIGL